MNRKGVLLVNLGTPDAPTYNGLRTYLNQFLTDRRVIDTPWPWRQIIFKGIVAPLRSGKVSKLYQKIWMEEGSPLKVYGERVAKGVQDILGDEYVVELAMRIQNPSIESALNKLKAANVSEIVVFPMFPQYSSATTGSVFEEVMTLLGKREQIPNIRMINSYYEHPDMLSIFVDNARKMGLENYDHFIFSFHGVPTRYLKKENNYSQCNVTGHAIAALLNIPKEKYTIAYQSKFGREEWVQPYLDNVLKERLEKGEKKVMVFSPSFVADCLETTMELAVEYNEEFIEEGGERLDLVPSLNDDPRWIRIIADLVR
ncbi:UNVERIFIED_CONTAM: hypothetical protein GTU68_063394 [Idotea baltica]|nr:hypothetical protein [Idotea baltica]